jgi:site-specific recombinase XerD
MWRKHSLILMLTYSAGLRMSEVVLLKPRDIDIQRDLIHVKGVKGRKFTGGRDRPAVYSGIIWA